MPTNTTDPSSLCHQLRDLIVKHLGTVTNRCETAATVLACALRQHNLDAKVRLCCYVADYEWPERYHAYVLCNGLTCDPTREQFDNLPLISAENDNHYRRSTAPEDNLLTEQPTIDDLAACFTKLTAHADYNKWLTICSQLGLNNIPALSVAGVRSHS